MSDLTLRIGDVCTKIYSGGTPKSTIPSYYEPGVIPWLNSGEVQFKPIYQTEKFISEEGLANSAAKWVYPPAVSVAMYGATAGNAAMVEIPLTTNQAICNLIIDDTKADYRFVYYALKWLNSSLVTLANGAAQQNLNAKTVADFTIPNLPIEKQKKIADVLSTLDKKIELNRRLNDNLEAMAQALYDYWFVQFDFPDENGKPYKSSGGKMVWNEVLKRDIPEGWMSVTLGEVCKMYQPHTLSLSEIDDSSDYFVYGANGIIGKYCEYNHEESEVAIACRGNSCGTVNRTLPKSWITGNAMVIKMLDSGVHNEYILRTIPHIGIHRAISGSGQPQITRENLQKLKLAYPDNNKTLKRYSEIAQNIVTKLLNLSIENFYLSSQRDFLLPLLMNGQVQVKPQGVNYHLSGN